MIELGGKRLVELEDVTRCYRHPSIADIKVGLRTWYPSADPKYIERCKLKDAATTQARLGFKVCGMQVGCSCASFQGTVSCKVSARSASAAVEA